MSDGGKPITYDGPTKIGRECEDLLANQHVESVDGGVAKDLVVVESRISFFGQTEIRTRLRNIDLITLH